MSFIKKHKISRKQSTLKPIFAIAAVFLLVGGTYFFFGNQSSQNQENNEVKKEEAQAQQDAFKVAPSGIDKDKKIKTVADVEEVMAKWIENNPQAILMSVNNMQKKMMEDQMKNAQKNIPAKAEELFNDKNSPEYAPAGYDVSIVEFFDYSCGYCKKAQSLLDQFLKQDAKVRVIFKEFPILGQASQDMAEIAIAVHISEGSSAYKKVHDAFMKSSARNKADALKIVKGAGVNVAKVEATLKKEKEKIAKILQDNRALATAVGISGTPGFIVGEELIPGMADVESLKSKVAAIRNKAGAAAK